MTTRITVSLEKDERQALDWLARQEFRDIRQQAAVIIRRELEQRGLLPSECTAGRSTPVDEVSHER